MDTINDSDFCDVLGIITKSQPTHIAMSGIKPVKWQCMDL